MFWFGMTIGLMIGGAVGVFALAACQLADEADRRQKCDN